MSLSRVAGSLLPSLLPRPLLFELRSFFEFLYCFFASLAALQAQSCSPHVLEYCALPLSEMASSIEYSISGQASLVIAKVRQILLAGGQDTTSSTQVHSDYESLVVLLELESEDDSFLLYNFLLFFFFLRKSELVAHSSPVHSCNLQGSLNQML